MAKSVSRTESRHRRHARVRKTVFGTPERPRLSVFRGLEHIYAQVIDDRAGTTLVSASSIDTELRAKMAGLNKSQQAALVGEAVAQRAKAKGIDKVVFDRSGYRYIGRVKSLADGARKAGLDF